MMVWLLLLQNIKICLLFALLSSFFLLSSVLGWECIFISWAHKGLSFIGWRELGLQDGYWIYHLSNRLNFKVDYAKGTHLQRYVK
uniref:Putative secreted peptide n=1 Tax=Anopheles braziliensis TaxID=58242 RepID=A0A2M3ZX04_9DIPT